MTVQLKLSGSDWRGLGVRHHVERRRGERRATPRAGPDRRGRDRRRAGIRSLLFGAAALVLPQQLRPGAVFAPTRVTQLRPHVSTSIDSFVAVEPHEAYDNLIQEASTLYRVNPSLIKSVMQSESAFDPSAVSRSGAMGLMQLMPDIAEAFGVEHPLDPRENIMAGARLLRELLDQYGDRLDLVLAGYNAGTGQIARYGGTVPPFAETQGYVTRVTGLMNIARRESAGDDIDNN